MYQSTYELEKLAQMKHTEFLERAERSRRLRFAQLRKREDRRSITLSSYSASKSTCNSCA
jgi:hypothetical protein